MNRRELLRNTISAGAGLMTLPALNSIVLGANEGKGAIPMPTRTLGRTGQTVSLLGIGCAPFRRDQVSVENVSEMLYSAVAAGVNYFDTAPNYGNAEEKMGPALKDKQLRDKMFIVTKTEEPGYDGTMRLLEQSLKRMNIEHVELVHIHNFGWEKRFDDLDMAFGPRGCLAALEKAKSEGTVKYIGASGHVYPSRFHKILDTGKVDVLMNSVNFIVQHSYDFESKIWSRAREENIGLVAMKVLGGANRGKGFRIPEKYYTQAVRYALSLPGLSTAVIGIENMSELNKAITTVKNEQPLKPDEMHMLSMEGLKITAAEQRWQSAYGKPIL